MIWSNPILAWYSPSFTKTYYVYWIDTELILRIVSSRNKKDISQHCPDVDCVVWDWHTTHQSPSESEASWWPDWQSQLSSSGSGLAPASRWRRSRPRPGPSQPPATRSSPATSSSGSRRSSSVSPGLWSFSGSRRTSCNTIKMEVSHAPQLQYLNRKNIYGLEF